MTASQYALSFRKMLTGITVISLLGICLASAAFAADTINLSVKMVAGLTAADQAAVIARNGGVEKSVVAPLRLHVVSVPTAGLPLILSDYKKDPQVESVEVIKARKAEGLPNDQHVGVQWSLSKIGWPDVYGKVSPKGTAMVALLDTGVDATHPDLKGNVIAGTSILDGSNGLKDSSGHGTQMAGIVAAVTGNSKGIAGIAYKNVKIMPVTVLDATGVGQDSDIIAGVVWAADHGANVILMGFSNPDFSQHLQDAIDYAWAKGAVLVAATGNGGADAPTFPAGDRGVIGVSATDPNDVLAGFSNFGQYVFVAAPGTDIYSTTLNKDYTYISGTSPSSAVVAGVAAFMKAVDPTLTNGVILGRLARSADPANNPDDPAFTGKYGYGRVNMAKALADTGTGQIEPLGAATAAGGVVGPYKAATSTTYNAGTTTWTAPTGVTQVLVQAWGAGGGGGTGTAGTVAEGGGGGGAFSSGLVTVTPATGYPAVVGAGGTASIAGGDSSFSTTTTVLAKGGSSVANNTRNGATGGQSSGGYPTTDGSIRFSGGNGGTGSGTNSGAGGGSAGAGSSGGNGGTGNTIGSGGTGTPGGAVGGAGRIGSNGAGTTGTAPGGGGGGAYRTNGGTQNGGSGANGRVIVTYFMVTFSGNNSTGGTTTPQGRASATNLTANGFTRTGYTFSGWNTAANGSGTP